MQQNRWKLLTGAALAVGVVLVVVVVWENWKLLVPLGIAVFVLGFLAAIRRPSYGVLEYDSPSHSDPAPEPTFVSRNDEFRVSAVPIPSKIPDYDFLLSATVRWWPSGQADGYPPLAARGIAVDSVIARARQITEQRDPGRSALVEKELQGRLGVVGADRSGLLGVAADDVVLGLPPEDRERLKKLAAVRKDEEVWNHERRWEENRRKYLGEDVLKDTGSAVVWWLARNGDHVENAVGEIERLARLSAAANNRELPDWFQHTSYAPNGSDDPFSSAHSLEVGGLWSESRREPRPTDLIDRFLDLAKFETDDPRRELFGQQIALILEKHGNPGIAEELREHFGESVPPSDEHAARDVEPAAGPNDPDDNPDYGPDPDADPNPGNSL
ncbi:hypothetical protein MXD62_16075 [Frankia sp. Mgl5]|uniref:hypothetical protein n=1 Tax=Frankia sp. Mgl5 TaxID=2933793 RepID=UPI00200DCA97|nr:hypothetical protein [Frankia sp. Mgl5]MCK9928672.1 hypothetical protein [Frankia sp. Mgl5]